MSITHQKSIKDSKGLENIEKASLLEEWLKHKDSKAKMVGKKDTEDDQSLSIKLENLNNEKCI